MESLAGGASMLSTDAIVPALEGEQDRNLEREGTEQETCRCDCKHVESNAAISTLRDGAGMDTLLEQMGKTSKNTSWCLCSCLLLVLELLCFINGAQAENSPVLSQNHRTQMGFFWNTKSSYVSSIEMLHRLNY